MPLDAHHVSTRRRLDGLDDAVRRGRDDIESARIVQCLDVVTVDEAVEAATSHRMGGTVSMLVGGVEMIGKVLVEMAAGMQAHHLHSEADPEHREIRRGLFESVEQFEFECLAIGCDEGRGRMHRLIEPRGVRIVAAAQDHPIEMRNDLRGRPGIREEGDRDSAGVRHASGVTPAQTDLVVDEVGGDTNEGSSMRDR